MNEKGGGDALWGAKRILNVLRGALPHCPFEMADFWINKEGDPTFGLQWAYKEAAVSVLGLIRGCIRARVAEIRQTPPDDPRWQVGSFEEQDQLAVLFQEARRLQKEIIPNPKAAFEKAFDYLEAMNLRISVVVPARALIGRCDEATEAVGDLTRDFPDLTEDLVGIRARLHGYTRKPGTARIRDLVRAEREIDDVRRRTDTVRRTLAEAVAQREGRRGGKQRRKNRRPGGRGNWRAALFPEEASTSGSAAVA